MTCSRSWRRSTPDACAAGSGWREAGGGKQATATQRVPCCGFARTCWTAQRDGTSTREQVPKCRSAEVPECRSAGVPECRSAEVPECRSAGVPKCRSAGVPKCDALECRSAEGRRAEVPECRSATRRSAGVPECRSAEVPKCRSAARIRRNNSHRLNETHECDDGAEFSREGRARREAPLSPPPDGARARRS